ncbi:DUF2783 domain-containing protein [Azoarcus indigens]|uniref:Uncharacterized protein DUF2783 n=1 Tax=Azoarcus indigens TaxID=29545 RepID=A0A4R6E0Q4_9RHOO|nr:DUF2783 domain-containing protein [Azoarcus indigens]NMG66538.1 DUF2783 domain-containing protein [Azoarcus indigens]TDN51275.1 uncharacterized protein DUF2783 [Azoarcus indigens]
MSTLSIPDLERIYDLLAEAVDAVPQAEVQRLLAKLALLAANEIGDVERFSGLLAAARRDL